MKNIWLDEYEKICKGDFVPPNGLVLMSKAMVGTLVTLGKLGETNKEFMRRVTKESK